jgi:hypothetical protein
MIRSPNWLLAQIASHSVHVPSLDSGRRGSILTRVQNQFEWLAGIERPRIVQPSGEIREPVAVVFGERATAGAETEQLPSILVACEPLATRGERSFPTAKAVSSSSRS